MTQTDKRIRTDSMCGYGQDERWVLVTNTQRPGCPAFTKFTFKEKVAPWSSDERIDDHGPHTAPLIIVTCHELPFALQPIRQEMPDSTPVVVAGPQLVGSCGRVSSSDPSFVDCESAKRSLASARSAELRKSNPRAVEEEYTRATDALSRAGDIQSQNQILQELMEYRKKK